MRGRFGPLARSFAASRRKILPTRRSTHRIGKRYSWLSPPARTPDISGDQPDLLRLSGRGGSAGGGGRRLLGAGSRPGRPATGALRLRDGEVELELDAVDRVAEEQLEQSAVVRLALTERSGRRPPRSPNRAGGFTLWSRTRIGRGHAGVGRDGGSTCSTRRLGGDGKVGAGLARTGSSRGSVLCMRRRCELGRRVARDDVLRAIPVERLDAHQSPRFDHAAARTRSLPQLGPGGHL
jgi:hypothetical protein